MGQLIFVAVLAFIAGCAIGWIIKASRGPAADCDRTAELLAATVRADRAEESAQQTRAVGGEVKSQLQPLAETLQLLAKEIREGERHRTAGMAGLSQQMHTVAETNAYLTETTSQLAGALRAPQIRGRWGELQLERVAELSGMLRHCDFDTQVSATTPDGQSIRPDMVIQLPGDRFITVDAKVPLAGYLDALEAPSPEEHAALLKRHAVQLKNHVNQLAARRYPTAFGPAPEFTVLFVPADPFLSAALNADTQLFEYALAKDIVIATPSTLLALLRTVALGWRQDSVNQRAATIQALGTELYHRIGIVTGHLNKTGAALDKAVSSFNATLSSIDTRLTVTARQLADMDPVGSPHNKVDPVTAITSRPRQLPELPFTD